MAPSTKPSVLLTPAGRDAIQRELEELRARRDRRLASDLRAVRETAGVDERDEELWAAHEEERVTDARIARLEEVLEHATIVDDGPGGVVAIGSRVRVADERDETVEYELVGSHQASGRGVVSAGSPVGQALLGRGPGERVAIELPNGRVRELRIVAVD
jgi:transcription elongation factor GreA